MGVLRDVHLSKRGSACVSPLSLSKGPAMTCARQSAPQHAFSIFLRRSAGHLGNDVIHALRQLLAPRPLKRIGNHYESRSDNERFSLTALMASALLLLSGAPRLQFPGTRGLAAPRRKKTRGHQALGDQTPCRTAFGWTARLCRPGSVRTAAYLAYVS